jgi:signal transduction histidine kinase
MNLKDFTDVENSRKGREAFRSVHDTGHVIEAFEWCITRKDGVKRNVEASVSLVRDSNGLPAGFRGILHDVTERKLAEEERNQLSLQLRQAQKMEALGTLAGGIAHNFNNLLMGIQGYASLMLLEAAEDPPQRKMLESIQKQVQSGARLTTQLLGYAREGKFTVQPFQLNDLMQETATTFGATRKDIMVTVDPAPDLPPILGDNGQIEQILMNLLINAADAMPRGGEVILRTRSVTPDVMSEKPYEPKAERYVLLSVQDDGLGMDRETRDRIFEPFFTTKGLVNGTGLGLASVYGIVKAHGGYIDVESEPGEGATFSVFLPATRASDSAPPPPRDPARGGRETILLVDDEAIILEVGGRMLRQLGYHVLAAESGAEALEVYRSHNAPIHLVIFDMIMPGMSGNELFEGIRRIDPGVRALLSSGYGLNNQAREILDSGCAGFIQKPFDLRELSRKVRELLEA